MTLCPNAGAFVELQSEAAPSTRVRFELYETHPRTTPRSFPTPYTQGFEVWWIGPRVGTVDRVQIPGTTLELRAGEVLFLSYAAIQGDGAPVLRLVQADVIRISDSTDLEARHEPRAPIILWAPSSDATSIAAAERVAASLEPTNYKLERRTGMLVLGGPSMVPCAVVSQPAPSPSSRFPWGWVAAGAVVVAVSLGAAWYAGKDKRGGR